jgi:pimeloyl-ACP methyl ester carboxylesterase
MSGRYLAPTAERLAADFRVYAPDLPGFGRSPSPARVLDVVGLADALSGWMDARGLARALLLGNSLGCQVIVALAARRPDLVGAVVLVGPTADPAGRSVPRLVARAAVDVFWEDRALFPIIVRGYLRAGVRRTWLTIQHLVADRPEDRLPLVGVPALVVRGGRDAIVPGAWAAEVARRLPRGRLLTVPGAAHAVNFGAPGPLAAAVRALAPGAGLTGGAPPS